jgi:hypothetical protein
LKFPLKRSGDLVIENKPIPYASFLKFILKLIFLSVSKPVIIEMCELQKETLQINTLGCFLVGSETRLPSTYDPAQFGMKPSTGVTKLSPEEN